MARFDKLIATAERLIAKNGELVTLRNYTAAAPPDPSMPWKPGGNSPNDQPDVAAVFLDYNQKWVDGTVIQQGDRRVLMPGADVSEPSRLSGQIIRGSGETWNIENVKPLDPNGQIIIYDIQVRQ